MALAHAAAHSSYTRPCAAARGRPRACADWPVWVSRIDGAGAVLGLRTPVGTRRVALGRRRVAHGIPNVSTRRRCLRRACEQVSNANHGAFMCPLQLLRQRLAGRPQLGPLLVAARRWAAGWQGVGAAALPAPHAQALLPLPSARPGSHQR